MFSAAQFGLGNALIAKGKISSTCLEETSDLIQYKWLGRSAEPSRNGGRFSVDCSLAGQESPRFPPSPPTKSLKASQQHTVAGFTPRSQSTAKPCSKFIICGLVSAKFATKAIIESLEFFGGAGSVYARGLSLTVKTFRFKRVCRYGCAALELPACPAKAGTLHVAVHNY